MDKLISSCGVLGWSVSGVQITSGERCTERGNEAKKNRKIPMIIRHGLIFVHKAFLLGLRSGELIFGWACLVARILR